jgi:hypothetical protein
LWSGFKPSQWADGSLKSFISSRLELDEKKVVSSLELALPCIQTNTRGRAIEITHVIERLTLEKRVEWSRKVKRKKKRRYCWSRRRKSYLILKATAQNAKSVAIDLTTRYRSVLILKRVRIERQLRRITEDIDGLEDVYVYNREISTTK